MTPNKWLRDQSGNKLTGESLNPFMNVLRTGRDKGEEGEENCNDDAMETSADEGD